MINYKERISWSGLLEAAGAITERDAVFIADTSTEFSWLTNRQSAKLRFSGRYVPLAGALSNLAIQSVRLGVSYSTTDAFTDARRGTLDQLLFGPLSIGNQLMLNGLLLAKLGGRSKTDLTPSLVLVAQTEAMHEADYIRIYEFVTA